MTTAKSEPLVLNARQLGASLGLFMWKACCVLVRLQTDKLVVKGKGGGERGKKLLRLLTNEAIIMVEPTSSGSPGSNGSKSMS